MLRPATLPSTVLGLLLALTTVSGAAAQEPSAVAAQEPPAAASAAEGPRVLATSDIPRAADDTTRRRREIDSFLAPTELATEIGEELPAVEENLAQLAEELDQRDPQELSLRGLDRAIQRWMRADKPLASWQARLEAKSSQVEEKRIELAEMRGLWERTRDSLPDDTPEAVRERLASVLGRIGETRASSRARLDELVTLQDAIFERRTRIEEALTLLEEARRAANVRIFTLDRPPLWGMLASTEHRDTLGSQARDAGDDSWTVIVHFFADGRAALIAQAIVFLALLLVVLVLRARGRRWMTPNPRLEAASRILAKPVAAALLLTLVASRLFHGLMPFAVSELLLLLLLVPVLRLLPGLIAPQLRAPLLVLAGLFVLDRVRELLGAETLAGRLFLLAVPLAALAGVLWTLRPAAKAAPLAAGPWWRLARSAARLAVLLLAGSIVANLIGSVRLASLLSTATLLSAYAAVILFAGVVVVEALLRVALETPAARSVRFIRAYSEAIERRLGWAIHLAALAWWLWIALRLYRVQYPVRSAFTSLLVTEWTVGELSLSIGGLLAFALTLWISVRLSTFIRIVLEEDILTKVRLPRGVPGTISMMARFAVLTLGFLAAASAAGFQLSQFTLIFGALGVGVGFGLQNVVNNFVSGLILAFERPVRVGDTIQTGTLLGRVGKIGIRSSTVRTFEGAEVIVPNSHLIAEEVVNWTLSDQLRRIELPVAVAYGTDPRRVVELLVATVERHEKVLSQPAPCALFQGFGDSSLDFVLRFWTADFDTWMIVASEVAISVSEALKDAEIEIPFPQHDLHLRSLDPSFERSFADTPPEDPA